MKKTIFIYILFLCAYSYAQQNDFIIAENYYRNNKFSQALQVYKKLYAKSPYNTTYLQRLISCHQEQEQFTQVANLVSKKLKKNKNQAYLHVVLGYNYEKQHRKKEAEKAYTKAIKIVEKKANQGGLAARFFKEYSKLNYAIKVYEILKIKNTNANYNFQLAQIYGELGNFNKMFTAYIDLVAGNKSYLNTVKRYSARYITNNPEDENNILFKNILLQKSISNPKNRWNNLLAWLFIKQKQYAKALLQKKALLLRDATQIDGIKELAIIAFENNDYTTAKKCFTILLEKVNNPSEKFWILLKNIEIAIATKAPNISNEYETILNSHGYNSNTLFIQLSYAKYLTFQKNNPQKAIAILENAMQYANSKHLQAKVKLQLGEALVFTEKFNKALIYFSQVQTQFKNHPLGQEARFKVAQTSYFKGDFKWAKAQLKVLKSSVSQLIANDAVDLFLTISENQPKDSIATGLKAYAKIGLLAYQQKNKKALHLLEENIAKFKGQTIEDEFFYTQGTLLEKEALYTKALESYHKLININKEGILVDDAYYRIAELYATKLNNPKKAKEYYQKIIFDHANSIHVVAARKKFRTLRGDLIN